MKCRVFYFITVTTRSSGSYLSIPVLAILLHCFTKEIAFVPPASILSIYRLIICMLCDHSGSGLVLHKCPRPVQPNDYSLLAVSSFSFVQRPSWPNILTHWQHFSFDKWRSCHRSAMAKSVRMIRVLHPLKKKKRL